jgi:hypothetical protein
MRPVVLASILLLSACTTLIAPPPPVTSTLTPADAATSLAVGGPITMAVQTPPPNAAPTGEDPVILMTLRSADGRRLSFEEANHAPNQVRAQAPGGPLAQTMGLIVGDETPKLYAARASENSGAPFICGPTGPANIGYYQAPDGAVLIVGLKGNFEFETLSDGTVAALPFSPDQVCARLHFRRSTP